MIFLEGQRVQNQIIFLKFISFFTWKIYKLERIEYNSEVTFISKPQIPLDTNHNTVTYMLFTGRMVNT